VTERIVTGTEGALQRAVSAFRLPFEGGRLLLRERQLWGLALVPLLLSITAFAAALGFVIAYASEIHSGVTAWMPVVEATRWYAWLWVAPARLGLVALGALLFLAAAGVCLVIAYIAASLLASPFHDVLARRVERIVTGRVLDETESGLLGTLREGGRALREELRRIAFFLGVVGPLAAIGLLIPGAQIVTGPTIMGFTLLFLPLDYASYTLDRRRVSFAAKRRWVRSRAPTMLGFGAAAFLTCLVPGLNFVAMPVLVVGGTLLALRCSPDREGSPAGPRAL
jgi:CysZ protein